MENNPYESPDFDELSQNDDGPKTLPNYRRRKQAGLLFFLAPVGVLGFLAQLSERPVNIGLAAMFAVVTPVALALGIWLWRKTDDD